MIHKGQHLVTHRFWLLIVDANHLAPLVLVPNLLQIALQPRPLLLLLVGVETARIHQSKALDFALRVGSETEIGGDVVNDRPTHRGNYLGKLYHPFVVFFQLFDSAHYQTLSHTSKQIFVVYVHLFKVEVEFFGDQISARIIWVRLALVWIGRVLRSRILLLILGLRLERWHVPFQHVGLFVHGSYCGPIIRDHILRHPSFNVLLFLDNLRIGLLLLLRLDKINTTCCLIFLLRFFNTCRNLRSFFRLKICRFILFL